ncbi:MAG TPA: hypothetical protein VM008_10025 [Phycisphaerae bacterium]|nr:hypothetical protein [Phycisphaerae bacterium]
MKEHQHVKTTPGENVAPEVVEQPIRPEPGSNMQMDDINIPLLAVSVAFFAVCLLILVIGLQAWFYHYDNAERAAKMVPEGDPSTPLGQMLENAHAEMYGKPVENPRFPKEHVMRIPIDNAMEMVAERYKTEQAR